MTLNKEDEQKVEKALKHLMESPFLFKSMIPEIRVAALQDEEVLNVLKKAGEVPKKFKPTTANILELDKKIKEDREAGTGISAFHDSSEICPECGHKGMNYRKVHGATTGSRSSMSDRLQTIYTCPKCGKSKR